MAEDQVVRSANAKPKTNNPEDTNLLAGASIVPKKQNPRSDFDPLNETAQLAQLGVGHFGLFNPLEISTGAVRDLYAGFKQRSLGQKPELILASALMGVKGLAYTAATNALADSGLGESHIEKMRSFSTGGGNVNS